MLWMTVALGADCPVVLTTRGGFQPQSARLELPDKAGGWRKSRMQQLPPSRLALVEMYKSTFRDYPVEIQERLLDGELPSHLDEVAATIAWGEPEYVWRSGGDCRALLYGVTEPQLLVLESCKGALQREIALARPIDCARLIGADDRLQRGNRKLRGYTLEQQVEIVGGHRAAWMDKDALELAFGKDGHLAEGGGPILWAEPVQAPVVTAPPATAPPVAVSPEAAPTAGAPALAALAETPGIVPAAQPTEPTPAPAALGEPVPSPSPSPAPRRPEAIAYRLSTDAGEPLPAGQWTFELTCGGADWELRIDVRDGYTARASSRSGDGRLVRNHTRGVAQWADGVVQLVGSGTLQPGSPMKLTLGPWPSPACSGRSADAVPSEP